MDKLLEAVLEMQKETPFLLYAGLIVPLNWGLSGIAYIFNRRKYPKEEAWEKSADFLLRNSINIIFCTVEFIFKIPVFMWNLWLKIDKKGKIKRYIGAIISAPFVAIIFINLLAKAIPFWIIAGSALLVMFLIDKLCWIVKICYVFLKAKLSKEYHHKPLPRQWEDQHKELMREIEERRKHRKEGLL